ncbi:restriction endonuclease subunit S [Streptococcus mutans]|uniref:restriction endonuclease subunit S n=1 Tax=Streptococcus mutans TaxID=1309 RepID=UPI000B5467BC|nr:restriction endonuclease subunit S [Streptococcus mutans]
MNNWKKVKLSDIINFNPREILPKGTIAKKIAMEKLEPFTRDIPEFEQLEFKGGTKFRNGDTLIARITPSLENGKTAKVSLLDKNEVGFGSTEFIVARAKESISDENFVYYLMLNPSIREVAIKSMVGTSGRQRVQLDVVKNHEILCPPLEEQIQIGKILSVIDDKIENNKKINHQFLQFQHLALMQGTLIYGIYQFGPPTLHILIPV